jgi:AraC-like DNA-binding protein
MKKSQGFEGEIIIEIPQSIQNQCLKLPLIKGLFISRMGFYPKALHHYFNRASGISQAILLYCTDGKGCIQLRKKKVNIVAGEVFVIPSGVPHTYRADSADPWTIYWFHIGGSLKDETIAAIADGANGNDVSYIGFSDERNLLFQTITATFLKGYSAKNLVFANLSLQYYLATIITPENFRKDEDTFTKKNPTNKAIVFMQQNLSIALALDNIAQVAQLSTSFFSRLFKQDTGYSPMEYFNHLRIQKACQLLHFSELRINEVALSIGIDDPFYFARLFRKHMGMSPVAYRNNYRN